MKKKTGFIFLLLALSLLIFTSCKEDEKEKEKQPEQIEQKTTGGSKKGKGAGKGKGKGKGGSGAAGQAGVSGQVGVPGLDKDQLGVPQKAAADEDIDSFKELYKRFGVTPTCVDNQCTKIVVNTGRVVELIDQRGELLVQYRPDETEHYVIYLTTVTGNTIIAGVMGVGKDKYCTVNVWDVESGALLFKVDENPKMLPTFSAEGDTLVIATRNLIKLLDLNNGQPLYTIPRTSGENQFIALSNNKILVEVINAKSERVLEIIELYKNREGRINRHRNQGEILLAKRSLLWAVSNNFLVEGKEDLKAGTKSVDIGDIEERKEFSFDIDPQFSIKSLSLSGSGSKFAIGLEYEEEDSNLKNNIIRVFDILKGGIPKIQEIHLFDAGRGKSSLQVSMTENKVIVGHKSIMGAYMGESTLTNNEIFIWDLSSGDLSNTLKANFTSIEKILVEGDKVFIGTKEGTVTAWEIESGKKIKEFRSPDSEFRFKDFKILNNHVIVAYGKEGMWGIGIWNYQTEKLERIINATSHFSAFDVSNGKIFASSYKVEKGKRKDIQITRWNMKTGQKEKTFPTEKVINNIVVLADKIVAISTFNNTFYVYEKGTGNIRRSNTVPDNINQASSYKGGGIIFAEGKHIKYYLPETGDRIPLLEVDLIIFKIVDQYIITNNLSGVISIWDMDDSEEKLFDFPTSCLLFDAQLEEDGCIKIVCTDKKVVDAYRVCKSKEEEWTERSIASVKKASKKKPSFKVRQINNVSRPKTE